MSAAAEIEINRQRVGNMFLSIVQSSMGGEVHTPAEEVPLFVPSLMGEEERRTIVSDFVLLCVRNDDHSIGNIFAKRQLACHIAYAILAELLVAKAIALTPRKRSFLSPIADFVLTPTDAIDAAARGADAVAAAAQIIAAHEGEPHTTTHWARRISDTYPFMGGGVKNLTERVRGHSGSADSADAEGHERRQPCRTVAGDDVFVFFSRRRVGGGQAAGGGGCEGGEGAEAGGEGA